MSVSSVTECIIYYCCDHSSILSVSLYYYMTVCLSYLIAALSSKLANVSDEIGVAYYPTYHWQVSLLCHSFCMAMVCI